MKKVLGLDLGTASVGWAYINDDNENSHVVELGARSFEEAVEPKSRESKNVARRTARLARRTIARRALRKAELKRILQKNEMCPKDNLHSWETLDPYLLRTQGLESKLSPQEFGRALYHLCQRRGFLSNRKAKGMEETDYPEVNELIRLDEEADIATAKKSKTSSDEESAMLAEIAALREQIENSGCKTVGEFFQKKLSSKKKVRARHTLREMFEREFKLLWKKQSEFYPEKYSDSLKAQIFKAIFHQRPLKDQSNLRNNCDFEPSKKVTLRSHYLFQEFRILSELHNIRLKTTKDWKERPLNQEEVQKAFEALQQKSKLTIGQLRTLLNPRKKEHIIINLEESGVKQLIGNTTHVALNSATNNEWIKYDEETKLSIMDELISPSTDKVKLDNLVKSSGLDPERAYHIVVTSFGKDSEKTANYSLKAIKKMLPHLKNGLDKHRAQKEAGYEWEHEKKPDIKDQLEWEEVPNTRNPSVNKCIYETRKVINAIIKKHGKPDVIRIEMGRDLALSKDAKRDIDRANEKNRKSNDEAYKLAQENGVSEPKRNDLIKYRLWKECNESCPFTGKSIPLSELWGPNWDIEHLIPFSISLDDSFQNKTICDAEFNRNTKKNSLPSEIYSENDPRWLDMMTRVDDFKCGRHKKKLFAMKRGDMDDGFISRQLNDTRYASRVIRDYVMTLGIEVESSTGKHTSNLRKHWGLHNILNIDGEKNREDHRHHAIDAMVVALTSRSYVKRISDLYKDGGSLQHSPHTIPLPWDSIRNDTIEAVNQIVVTHEPCMRVRGALHEETGYGRDKEGKFTTRKALVDLTSGEISRIVDDSLRSKVEEHLYVEEGKLEDKLKTFRVIDKDGESHEIKRVKIYARGQNEDRYFKTRRAYYPSGSNQWLLITEDIETETYDATIVPLWQAVKIRKHKKDPKSLVPTGQRLVMLLQKNDMVELGGDKPGIYRVVKFSEENPVYLVLRPHLMAGELLDKRIRSRNDLPNIIRRLEVGMIDVR